MPEYVLGIDLGTSNSVVAALKEGEPEALRDSEGRVIQPSVVSMHPSGSILVGHEARARRHMDPQNTIYGVKRLMGRALPDATAQEYLGKVSFKAVEGDNQEIRIVTRDQEVTVPEISAMVLHHLKIIAERSLRTMVKKAVITVPANFNDAQRAATLSAGEIAGLEVLRVINEPTAAALAYGYGKDMDRRVIIYDFGGGTFDVTILDIRGDVYEVRATAGDTYLGGADLDERILAHMAGGFLREHRVDLLENEVARERLRMAAESLKCELSFNERSTVDLEDIAFGAGGKPLAFHYSLDRPSFERMAEEIVDRTFVICDEAFRLAGLAANQVDEVVLVGGTTRMPLVLRSVQSYFARVPLASINPDEVVALGAALQGAALAGETGWVAREASSAAHAPYVPATAPTPPAPPTAPKAGKPIKTAYGMPVPPLPPGVVLPPPLPDVASTRAGSSGPVPSAAPVSPLPSVAVSTPPPAPPWLSVESADLSEHRGAAPGVQGDRGSPPGGDIELDGGLLPDLELVPAGDDAPDAISNSHAPLFPAAPSSSPLSAPGVSPPAPPRRPLLLDVTPLSLGIATVGGYGQVLIPRNSPVPVETSRVFVTSEDNQTVVRLRICQGESKRFDDNTLLGELFLEGLSAAPRGEVKVKVTFELDASGILQVFAEDEATRQVQRASVQLRGQSAIGRESLQFSGEEGAYRMSRTEKDPGAGGHPGAIDPTRSPP